MHECDRRTYIMQHMLLKWYHSVNCVVNAAWFNYDVYWKKLCYNKMYDVSVAKRIEIG